MDLALTIQPTWLSGAGCWAMVLTADESYREKIIYSATDSLKRAGGCKTAGWRRQAQLEEGNILPADLEARRCEAMGFNCTMDFGDLGLRSISRAWRRAMVALLGRYPFQRRR
jgi:hypothetical protein